jgi:hypothetical protein
LLARAAFWGTIPGMTKRALLAVAGFLGLCGSLSAQLPDQMLLDGNNPNRSPWVSLEDRNQFSFSTAFGSMRQTENYLPTSGPWEQQSFAYLPSTNRKNSLDNAVDWRAPDKIQFGGEMGFLYGKSSGKNGREDFSSYIIGTIGNDKFSITAGFLHQESSGRYPRWRR